MSINTSWKHVLQFFKYRKTTKRWIKFEGRVLRCRWLPLAACQGAGEPGATHCPPWAQTKQSSSSVPAPAAAAPWGSQPRSQGTAEECGAVLKMWSISCFKYKAGNPRPVFSPSLGCNFSIPRGAVTKGPSLQDPRLRVSRAGKHRLGCGFGGAGRAPVTLLLAGWVGVKPQGSISQAIKICFFMGYSNYCWITNDSGDWYLKMGLF